MSRAALLLEESVRTLEQRLTKLWSKAWANSWSSFIPWRYHGARVICTYQYLSLPNTPDISDISAWWISWVAGESVEISWYIMLWHPQLTWIHMAYLWCFWQDPGIHLQLRTGSSWGSQQYMGLSAELPAESTLRRRWVALGAIEKLVQSGQFFDLRRKITGK